jgi:hypothetical protein
MAELLQPAGPDLARRWLVALLMVPREEREAIVAAVERRIGEAYPAGARAEPVAREPQTIEVVHPPRQRDGYVEQVLATYESVPSKSQSDFDGTGRQNATPTPARSPYAV